MIDTPLPGPQPNSLTPRVADTPRSEPERVNEPAPEKEALPYKKEAPVEVAPVEKEMAQDKASLSIKFELPVSQKTVIFTKKPLGLDFDKEAPIIIKRVQPERHGAELGVEAGWRILSLNDEDVGDKNFEYIYSKLQSEACLTIKFEVPGCHKTVNFTKRPLGLDFEKKAPIIMKRVQPEAHGAELGVEAGWKILSVNDEDVGDKDYQYIFKKLGTESAKLPA
jgi:predicted metalloprotease with PDZ domain